MYITLDFKCIGCGFSEERFIKKSQVEDQLCACNGRMKKQLAATKTHFRFADKRLKR